MSNKGRAVVVGSGVIGASVALELSRAGWTTTVIDSLGSPAQGSTSASSANVRYHYAHVADGALAWEGGHRWMDWSGFLATTDPLGMARFVRSGALVLNGDLMPPSALTTLKTLGIPVDELTGAEIRQRFPALDAGKFGPPTLTSDDRFWRDPDGDIGGYWVPDSGYVDDPQLAALNLAHAAKEAGCQFRFRVSMERLVLQDSRVVGVMLSSGEVIDADVVVNAAGPWSAEVNKRADALSDFTVSTRPLEQEVISLPVPVDFSLEAGGTCVSDWDLGTYFRPHGDTMIVGGMEAPCDPLVFLSTPSDARSTVSTETWELNSLRAARRVPSLTIPTQPRGVVGVYDVTDDWIPIYDKTSVAGYYVAIGTSGHGFKQAPVVGEIIRDIVEACESGHDHDRDPITVRGSYTGAEIEVGHFSRLRAFATTPESVPETAGLSQQMPDAEALR